jgi:hypothetical protein
VEEINAGGILGGRKIVIQYEDTAAVKEQAVNSRVSSSAATRWP